MFVKFYLTFVLKCSKFYKFHKNYSNSAFVSKKGFEISKSLVSVPFSIR